MSIDRQREHAEANRIETMSVTPNPPAGANAQRTEMQEKLKEISDLNKVVKAQVDVNENNITTAMELVGGMVTQMELNAAIGILTQELRELRQESRELKDEFKIQYNRPTCKGRL